MMQEVNNIYLYIVPSSCVNIFNVKLILHTFIRGIIIFHLGLIIFVPRARNNTHENKLFGISTAEKKYSQH